MQPSAESWSGQYAGGALGCVALAIGGGGLRMVGLSLRDGSSRPRRRPLGVGAIAVVVLLGALTSCSGDTVDEGSGVGFAVLAGADGVYLSDGEQVDRLDEFPVEETLQYGSHLAWYDERTAVVLAGNRLGFVTAEGASRTVECDGCSGLVIDQDRILTVRTNYRPAEGFDIVALDADLNEVGSVAAARVIERSSRQQLVENPGPPHLVTATPEAIYVTHVSRHGGSRRGPSVLAKYGRDGRLLDYMIIDGLSFDAVASRDQRYVAIAAGGSSGACRTTADVRVVDTADMRLLQTDPPVPGDQSQGSSSWFFAHELSWGDDGLLTAIGERHHLAPDQDCDEDPQVWKRTYDPATQSFSDDELDPIYDLRVIGPSCDDQVGYSGVLDRMVVGTVNGSSTPLADDAVILGVTSAGLVCEGQR